MIIERCPGQDRRKVKVEALACTKCGYIAEIFSDEIKIRCPQCKELIRRWRLPSCIDWCRSAKECKGGIK